jgi:hypothetical protein
VTENFSNKFRVVIVLCLSTVQTQCHRKPSNNAPLPKPTYEQMSSTSFTLRDASDRLSIMTQCPQRLWPDYSWSNFQVVFIEKDSGKALLWNDQAKLDQGPQPAISEIDSEDDLLKAAPSSGRFWTRMYRGARTIVMWRYATDTERALIGLTFHEGFHAVGQHSFQKVQFERGDNYPEDWHPRYIRRKLLESLMYFLLTRNWGKGDTGAGHGRSWMLTPNATGASCERLSYKAHNDHPGGHQRCRAVRQKMRAGCGYPIVCNVEQTSINHPCKLALAGEWCRSIWRHDENRIAAHDYASGGGIICNVIGPKPILSDRRSDRTVALDDCPNA